MKTKEQHEAEFETFALVERDGLRRYAYYLCGDWYEADDIVQKALTKLFAAWNRVDQNSTTAYVRRIVTNVFFSHRRKSWVRRERTTESMPAQSIERPQERVDMRLDIAAALDRLTSRERATLVLRYWEQLSVAETAAVLGCSTGTVKSQSSRGLGKLRRLMSESVAPVRA